jgi:AraC-like DNA-binding protein
MQRALAAARFLRTLLEAGERMGVDRAQALLAIGVTASEADDPGGWIPAARMTRAWELVPEMSGDPCFGLHAAETTPLGVFGPLDLAAMSSATVGDALERVVRYYATLGAMSDLRLATEKDGALRLTTKLLVKSKGDLRHFAENFFAIVVTRIQMVAMAASRADIDVTVRFLHSAPPDTAEHKRIFGARVHFGAARDELLIGRKTATMPLVTSNPELSPILEREGQRIGLRPDAPIAERVRRAIEQTMREGNVGLEDVARKLTMGPRTVQRLLQSDGTSFADVLDAARRELALKALEGGGVVLSELAFTLGFSQPSAFYRAFKRWTGKTPRDWKVSTSSRRPR